MGGNFKIAKIKNSFIIYGWDIKRCSADMRMLSAIALEIILANILDFYLTVCYI